MTKFGRENLIAVALVASVLLHVAIMVLVRSQVMTSVAANVRRAPRHFEMQMRPTPAVPRPVQLEAVEPVSALRDAPAAKADDTGIAEAMAAVDAPTGKPEVVAPAPPVAPDAPQIDVRKIEFGEATDPLPLRIIETPEFRADAVSAPSFGDPGLGEVSAPCLDSPEVGPLAPPTMVPALGRAPKREASAFKPAEEVLEAVDHKLVEAEKQAVGELLDDVANAEELVKFVNITLSSAQLEDWIYFKVMMSPRADLPVVPKDLVVLIDASGSIGDDRMSSVRGAAKRLLRSAINTGDRFNLVTFRDRYSYAFRRWQPCSQTAFAQAERWLNNEAAYGRTDVFSSISSVLTLPRDPKRPLVALVVTDGDANEGVSDTLEILSKFTALNDGLVSVYMYGVRSSSNRELIDILTHANRGESFIFEGRRWNAGNDLEKLTERFREPVLSDIRVAFSSKAPVEAYPRLLKNLYRGDTLSLYGRVPVGTKEVAFSVRGLNGSRNFEGYFSLPLYASSFDASVVELWHGEHLLDLKLK